MNRSRVTIHYRRPPDRVDLFEQVVISRTSEYVVTYLDAAPDREASLVHGEVILEPGSPIIWFTYPGRWYDVGRFHLADGTFTGYYANILTPVVMTGDRWETTDLFLDVWVSRTGSVSILDLEEFDDALARGWLDPGTADSARREADRLAAAAHARTWPGAEVQQWTLERATDYDNDNKRQRSEEAERTTGEGSK